MVGLKLNHVSRRDPKWILNLYGEHDIRTIPHASPRLNVHFNPLRAIFFRGNINMYLYFMSLLHIDMKQALKILPQIRPGPTYST